MDFLLTNKDLCKKCNRNTHIGAAALRGRRYFGREQSGGA